MDKRSSVLAVIMGGYGFGGMIIMPVIGRLIAAYGYQVAYRAHSAAGLILLLVTIIFIRDTPEQMGVKPYGWEKAQQIQAELEAKKALNDAKGGITLASAPRPRATGYSGSAWPSRPSPALRSASTTAPSSRAPSASTPLHTPTGLRCSPSALPPACCSWAS